MRPGWIRFRWPTWSAADAASPDISRSPPGKPANQPSCSASRLSSYSCWIDRGVESGIGRALDRSGDVLHAGLPAYDALMDRLSVRVLHQAGAEAIVGKHFGDLRQNFQVLLGHIVGYQQEGQQADRLAVGRLERD